MQGEYHNVNGILGIVLQTYTEKNIPSTKLKYTNKPCMGSKVQILLRERQQNYMYIHTLSSLLC